MPENRMSSLRDLFTQFLVRPVFAWVLRISPGIMRLLPFLYVGTVLLLVLYGFVLVFGIGHLSAPVQAKSQTPAQAAAADSTSASKPGSAPSPTIQDNSSFATHNSVVRRSTYQVPVDVSINNAPQPCCEAKPVTDISAELKPGIDDLKWVLTLILSAAGLFAIVQGIAAGFSAQSFQKQAADVFLSLEKLATEAKARFPIFSDTEERRQRAYQNLTRVLKKTSAIGTPDEGLDWRRQFYEQLGLLSRQEILSFERFVSFEFASQNEPRDKFAIQLRQLAHFYWSKFIYERGYDTGSLADLERAEYLLNMAKDTIGEQFFLCNDLGNVRLEALKIRQQLLPPNPTTSEETELKASAQQIVEIFEKSIFLQPEQVRAYYNLAWVHAEVLKDLDGAIEWLRKGIDYPSRLKKESHVPNWETRPVPDFLCRAHFNLACFLGRKAKADPSLNLDETVVAELYKAAAIGKMSVNDVNGEFKENGDFYYLLEKGDQSLGKRLMALKPQLSANAATG